MVLRAAPDWPVGPPDVRWRVPAALAGLLGAQLLSVIWVVAVAGVIYGSDDVPPSDERPIWTLVVFNIGLWLGYLCVPFVVHRLSESRSMADFELRSPPLQLLAGAALGVVTQLAVLPLLYNVVLRFIDGDPGRSAEQLVDRADGPVDVLLLVVAVVAVAPFVEEWFYRGMLLPTLVRGLRSAGRTRSLEHLGAAVITSALFAAVHQEAILLPGLFVFALILAWVTVNTGRLGPAVAAHVAFNATTLVQLLVFDGY